MGFAEVLGLVFIFLKLTGIITWSWFLVLSPLWISALLYIIIVIMIYVGFLDNWKRFR